MWTFKKKEKPVQALCDFDNYKVCVETENYAVIQPQIKQLTFHQALNEFEMLMENGYAVLGWLEPNNNSFHLLNNASAHSSFQKLLCRKTRNQKNERA